MVINFRHCDSQEKKKKMKCNYLLIAGKVLKCKLSMGLTWQTTKKKPTNILQFSTGLCINNQLKLATLLFAKQNLLTNTIANKNRDICATNPLNWHKCDYNACLFVLKSGRDVEPLCTYALDIYI